MEYRDLPTNTEQDTLILMHRDAHFGGNFEIMIDYYEKGGKGVRPELELSHILALHRLEMELEQDLAGSILGGAEAERVAKAKNAYKELRDLYDNPQMKGSYALLIADLILSEELEPESEIAAIVERKGAAIPALIELLKSQDFYDPLFPGYGFAPELAAKCLGLIGDHKAVISLFESIHEGDFFEEETALQALKAIGQPAKDFLLQVLRSRPINQDNERAAIALVSFKQDPEVAEACLELLLDPETRQNLLFSSYLALVCEGLQDAKLQQRLKKLAEDPTTPKDLRKDILAVSDNF